MIDPGNVPPVGDAELLARFSVDRGHVRADGTVKPQLFVPYKWVELSVNRHRDATDDETWTVGRQVAEDRQRSLIGRVDILTSDCRVSPLDVRPVPLEGNPNHTDIVGFPADKPDQMSLGEKLAAAARRPWINAPSN